jgi:alkylation response protein AidB-like acyl-CoA dehydrogenase
MDMVNLDDIDADAPIFDPGAFGLGDEEAELNALARRIGRSRFAPRAAEYDRDARFPAENYRELREARLASASPRPMADQARASAPIQRPPLRSAATAARPPSPGICIPALACGRERWPTILTCLTRTDGIFGGGACITSASSPMARFMPSLSRKVEITTARPALFPSRPPPNASMVAGWSTAGRFSPHSLALPTTTASCAANLGRAKRRRVATMFLAVPASAPGVEVVGDWDPLGLRGTVSRTLLLRDVFVDDDAALMPRGVYFQAASRWPHMFLTLTPTYLGLAQAAFDFTVRYLGGEFPEAVQEKRRKSATKQLAVAQVFVTLQQTKALWFQATSEARVDPTKEQVLRAIAAQYTVMENANDLARLAIRTCGGRSMFKALPLERLYRDSRCGSVMLPWTAEICLERIGRDSLYEANETDD